ncbi:GDSL-type esterase/lipase family protein [Fictibacillus sp. Mic-4]|uniref:GDSL-type esterase/lipase family protein n=1 Tax=Fictibacillus TaxID=1329200 RepID=UPI0003FA8B5F|nr:GDSL-type esterase/lipase family protein [Fictibacillus gelatini]
MRGTKKVIFLGAASMAVLLFFFSMHIYGRDNQSNKLKIVALGDSLTYGKGDPTRKGYIGRVRDGLAKKSGRPVILNNFGISGQRSDQLLLQLRNEVVLKSLNEADDIFLFIGTNDFRKSASWNFFHLDPERMAEGQKRLQKNLAQITKIIRSQNKNAPIYIIGLYNPYMGKVDDKHCGPTIRKWNRSIYKISQETPGATYIPTFDLFTHINKNTYFFDYIHPNERGYTLISKRVLKVVKPLKE